MEFGGGIIYDVGVTAGAPWVGTMRWSASRLAAACGGRLQQPGFGPQGPREIVGAFLDSRRPRPGALFVPIVAARDGHEFIGDAVAGGAAAVLIAAGHPRAAELLAAAQRAAPAGTQPAVIEVDDTLVALQRLATDRRRGFDGPVVAITGSNGKTTTRAMIAAVLATGYPQVLCTRGNLNNHLGVPLTLLGEPEQPDAMVIELGMSAPGENDLLASIVQPTIAVVTSIALEHLEFMGSIEAIAAAEAEPIAHVQPDPEREHGPVGGLVVVPSDEPLLAPHVAPAKLQRAGGAVELVRVGPDADADVRVVAVELVPHERGATTRVELASREHGAFTVSLQLFGVHNARNAAAAIAVGTALGLPLPPMIEALRQVEPVGDRGRAIACGRHLLVADCYNANPGSVAAALSSMAVLPGARRKLAVLGDMLELGPDELALHAEAGRACAAAGLDAVVGFGPRSRALVREAAAAGIDALATEDVDEATAWLLARMHEPSCVLLKGSRGMRLERVVEALQLALASGAAT